ncbi:MAG: cytochrome C oxidase subunit IV family protein [Bacteroidia bacterium]|nr:cytochrome C oxidase subunit IV family protein [Bacteroidia bacterium]
MAHHSEEEGKLKRKELWKVFFILSAITIVELIIGFYPSSFSSMALKIIFIGGTLLKAGFIVLSFMHLGEEVKTLRYIIIAPYVFFIIYLSFIALNEGLYSDGHKATMDKNVLLHSQIKGAEAPAAKTTEAHH